MIYLWIAIGSAFGGVARHWCWEMMVINYGETFPWGTILVNIIGSFIIGCFAVVTGPDGRFVVSDEIRQFVMIGICGGFTTFSAFSLQVMNQIHRGEFMHAGANIGLSIMLCLLSVWMGYIFATFINQLKTV